MTQQHIQVKQAQATQTDWMSRARGLTAVLGVGAALMAAAVTFDVRAESHRMHKNGPDGGHAEMWMGALGGHGKHAERMYKRLNLTPEQQARLQALKQAQKTERQTAHEAHQALHKDMQAFLSQPTWDEAEERTLRARALAFHQNKAEKHWQHMMDMAKVLTPEQRKQVMTMKEKRKSHHHKGAHEKRHSTDGMQKAY